MELANALYKIDMLVDDQGRTAEKEAWNNIRAYIAEVQKPAHNNARDEILLCGLKNDKCKDVQYYCQFPSSCTGQRKTSPVA